MNFQQNQATDRKPKPAQRGAFVASADLFARNQGNFNERQPGSRDTIVAADLVLPQVSPKMRSHGKCEPSLFGNSKGSHPPLAIPWSNTCVGNVQWIRTRKKVSFPRWTKRVRTFGNSHTSSELSRRILKRDNGFNLNITQTVWANR